MKRAVRAAYWITPSLICLAVYWLGLIAWFHQDDFAWLGLRLQIHSAGDLWRALFQPYAQGTFRFLSERAFFIVFSTIFGIDPLPFRIWVFLTQFANLILLSSITSRLTGSRVAGFLAPVLWVACSGLAVAMSWTSSYNEILLSFFFLLTFHFFLRHIDTGRRSYYIAQWITFLLGFGALEVNVVYPALAALYTLCCARKYFRKTLPLFAVSIAYTVLHLLVAPGQATGPYALHYDSRIFATLWTYWKWALGPSRLPALGLGSRFLARAGTVLLTAGLLGFAFWKIRRREWLAVFFLGWFGIVILPLLPLPDHISDYYLTVPTLGLAMLAGWALAEAWPRPGRSPVYAVVAILLAGIYLGSSVPATRAATRWRYERGREVQKLVTGVVAAHRLHPRQIILLKGVSEGLFWAGVFDKPFRLLDIPEVYLVPGSEAVIQARPELGQTANYILPPGPTLRALDRNEAVVYDVRGERLKNITVTYLSQFDRAGAEQAARRVEVANPAFAGQVGSGWFQPEQGYRWMSKSASLRLGAPRSAGQKLYINGYAPATLFAKGPIHLTIKINGLPFPPQAIPKPDSPFEISLDLPDQLTGKGELEVLLEVDRTVIPPGDGRQLGVALSSLEIR